MCFQILGFDIILDKNCKPFLLEVNHAPSFATETPLDYEIKKKLFQDTFQLLGLSVERKRAKVLKMYEDRKNRMTQKLTLKQKNQQRKLLQDAFKKESEEFEKKNLGNFDRIYPLALEDERIRCEKA